MVRFPNSSDFLNYLRNALHMTEINAELLMRRIVDRKNDFNRLNDLEFADYIDYDPFRAANYPTSKPGDFIVIHGHHVGEPKPRIIIQHLY